MAEASATDPPAPTYDEPLRRCLLCAGETLRDHDRDHRGHRIVRCAACGLCFMNPQYSDDWLRHYYSTYVPADGQSHDRGFRARPEVRRAGKTRALRMIERHVGVGRILMVGCGDGLELSIARELGWSVTGQDIDPATTRRVAAATGVPVLCAPFEQVPAPESSFDAVFLDQVIEHPKNPGDFLRRARSLLRPGGVLYLGQPNIGSLANRAKTWIGRLGLRPRRRGRHYSCQHHITYYRPDVLTRLLRDPFGFEVLEVCGSPKPHQRSWLDPIIRRFPLLDSSFVVLARRPRVDGVLAAGPRAVPSTASEAPPALEQRPRVRS